jgi:hypothetical protein
MTVLPEPPPIQKDTRTKRIPPRALRIVGLVCITVGTIFVGFYTFFHAAVYFLNELSPLSDNPNWQDEKLRFFVTHLARPICLFGGARSLVLVFIGIAFRMSYPKARLIALLYASIMAALPFVFFTTMYLIVGQLNWRVAITSSLYFMLVPITVLATMFLPSVRTYFAELNAATEEAP